MYYIIFTGLTSLGAIVFPVDIEHDSTVVQAPSYILCHGLYASFTAVTSSFNASVVLLDLVLVPKCNLKAKPRLRSCATHWSGGSETLKDQNCDKTGQLQGTGCMVLEQSSKLQS